MSIYKYLKAKIANPRQVSAFAVDMLHTFEGCKLTAYPDPGSVDGKPYTIGFGTTQIKGHPVQPGMAITLAEAELYFEEDLEEFEGAVRELVEVPLTQNEFDALVSLTYNIGITAFAGSTLLRFLNQEQYEAAAREFPRWNKNDGNVMEGLVKRREKERKHFLGELR